MLLERAAQFPTLNEVIHSYKYQLLDLKTTKVKLLHEKSFLESKLKLLVSSNFDPINLFKLTQENDSNSLEDNVFLDLELLVIQNLTSTQLIGEIVTVNASSKRLIFIFLSSIFGLFLSIFIVFINNFLKALKKEQV